LASEPVFSCPECKVHDVRTYVGGGRPASSLSQTACFLPTEAASGCAKGNGSEHKTGLGRVFDFKLGCFDDVQVLIYVDACPHLWLKTRPRFSPVILSLSMAAYICSPPPYTHTFSLRHTHKHTMASAQSVYLDISICHQTKARQLRQWRVNFRTDRLVSEKLSGLLYKTLCSSQIKEDLLAYPPLSRARVLRFFKVCSIIKCCSMCTRHSYAIFPPSVPPPPLSCSLRTCFYLSFLPPSIFPLPPLSLSVYLSLPCLNRSLVRSLRLYVLAGFVSVSRRTLGQSRSTSSETF
jgi:hypothetical protein